MRCMAMVPHRDLHVSGGLDEVHGTVALFCSFKIACSAYVDGTL